MALFMRATANKSLLLINNYYSKLSISDFKTRTIENLSQCMIVLKFHSHNLVYSSQSTDDRVNEIDRISPFDQFLNDKKREAQRSVIIQVQSPDSYSDLYSYCFGFGNIKQMQHYVVSKTSHFFLVQFEDVSSQQSLMKSTIHLNHTDIIPVQSQMLWFRNVKMKQKRRETVPTYSRTSDILADDEINQAISLKKNISEQMKTLHYVLKLSDIGVKLRFLTALQLESSFSSLFPNISALPFGSSINGFGRNSCDLDVVINLENNYTEKESNRLIFHTKSALSEERAQTKRTMDTIATIMYQFIPGIKNVRRILQARVPIVKYDHIFTGLECDLSMNSMTAIYMTELLYLFAESNNKVKPLVFTIRQWAHTVGVTNSSPGPWITNFSLSLMVLFFLQTNYILPPLKFLQAHARPADKRVTDTCVDCTFLRDLSKWPESARPNDTLEKLLHEFFHYYANFDFTTRAISLNEGASIPKIGGSTLYIHNPLEQSLNVSKNVSPAEVARFVKSSRNAALLMDDHATCSRGLIDIFAEKKPSTNYVIPGKTEKKVDLATIFQETNDRVSDSNKSGDTIRLVKKERARRR